MQTILIIGGTAEARETAIAEKMRVWEISPFDRIKPADESLSIGIGVIRTFIKNISLAPHQGDHVAGTIIHGEKLTVEAQQALLKTLEEPPGHAYIIIGIPNKSFLLPTIISRCMCVYLQEKSLPVEPEQHEIRMSQLRLVIASRPGQKIAAISSLGKSKENLANWIDNAIVTLRNEVLKNPHAAEPRETIAYTRLLHILIDTTKYQENNINLLMLLEHAFLSLDNTL